MEILIHSIETNKGREVVSQELEKSGSYDLWLADNLVTYTRNGFRLDKESINFQYRNHLNKVEGVYSNLVKGGHNKSEFYTTVYDSISQPNKRVLIINKNDLNQNGWSLIEYKTYKVDSAKNPVLPLQINAGDAAFKTVYEPSVVSEKYIKTSGYRAFKDAIDNNRFGIIYANDFEGISEGVVFTGFFDPSSKNIITWYVK